MVGEIADDHEFQWAAMNEDARLLGIGPAETVRKWVRQGEVDAGQRPGATSDEAAELKRLRRDNAELKRANGILKAAGTFFASMPSSEMSGRGSLVTSLPQHAGGFSRAARLWSGVHEFAGAVACQEAAACRRCAELRRARSVGPWTFTSVGYRGGMIMIMIMIGADSHKRTHTLVAVDDVGRRLAEKTVRTNTEGHPELLVWAARSAGAVAEEVKFALENCRHLTRRLEADLLAVARGWCGSLPA